MESGLKEVELGVEEMEVAVDAAVILVGGLGGECVPVVGGDLCV